MKILDKILGFIDLINGWTGRVVGHLLVVMMLIMSYEVIMRYVFTAPTLWAMELNQYLFLILVALCGGWVLLTGGHVNADVFYVRFSPRTKAIIDLITYLLFFIFIVILITQSWDVALDSIKYKEHSDMGHIPEYPVRVILVIGACLLLLQGLAKWIRDVRTAITGGSPVKTAEEPAAEIREAIN